MLASPFEASIVKRALQAGIVSISIHKIRDFTNDKHHVVDDTAYGGGDGMLMKPEPVFEAVGAVRQPDCYVVLTTPGGRLLDQALARRLSEKTSLVLICGRYEGLDERVSTLTDEELSIGDSVLSGVEQAAIVLVVALVRLLPGVI